MQREGERALSSSVEYEDGDDLFISIAFMDSVLARKREQESFLNKDFIRHILSEQRLFFIYSMFFKASSECS
jgi:hypothetical protein